MFGDRYTLRINLHHRWGAGFFRRRKGGRAREGPRRCKPGRSRRWSNCWYWGSTSWCVWDRNERSLCQSSAILTIRVQYWPFECNIVFMRNYIHWNTIMTVNAIFIFHHPGRCRRWSNCWDWGSTFWCVCDRKRQTLMMSVECNIHHSNAICLYVDLHSFKCNILHFECNMCFCGLTSFKPNMHRPVQCVFTRNLVHSNAIFIIQVQYFFMCMEWHLQVTIHFKCNIHYSSAICLHVELHHSNAIFIIQVQYLSLKCNISVGGITSFRCNIHHSSAIFIIQVEYFYEELHHSNAIFIIQMQYSSFKCNMQHSSGICFLWGITSFKCNIHHTNAIFIIQMQYAAFKWNLCVCLNTSLNNFEIVSYRERVCSIHAPSHTLSRSVDSVPHAQAGCAPPPPRIHVQGNRMFVHSHYLSWEDFPEKNRKRVCFKPISRDMGWVFSRGGGGTHV